MENYISYIFIKLIGINIPSNARKPNLLEMQHKFWVSTFQCFICMAMGGDFMKIPMVKESCSLIRGRRKKYVNQKGVNWKGWTTKSVQNEYDKGLPCIFNCMFYVCILSKLNAIQ